MTYGRLAEVGFEYGPAFEGLTAAWRDGEDVYAEVELPESAEGAERALRCTRRCWMRPARPGAFSTLLEARAR